MRANSERFTRFFSSVMIYLRIDLFFVFVFFFQQLTWFSLALSECVVDVYEGEVIPLWVPELSVTLDCLVAHTSRGLQKATRR